MQISYGSLRNHPKNNNNCYVFYIVSSIPFQTYMIYPVKTLRYPDDEYFKRTVLEEGDKTNFMV